jgi:hypothetical protein
MVMIIACNKREAHSAVAFIRVSWPVIIDLDCDLHLCSGCVVQTSIMAGYNALTLSYGELSMAGPGWGVL